MVLGGAGFIGSHVVRRLLDVGDRVILVDGLMQHSGGNMANIADIVEQVEFINRPVADIENFTQWVDAADVIIDCMAWTAHRLAIKNPQYDLDLNVRSHLHVVEAIKAVGARSVVYLGSRSQYGRIEGREIHETTPMLPVDIQGVHKVTAEAYYRLYAEWLGFAAVSLRICNVFGPGQPKIGPDIGLLGSIVRTCVADETVEIYGRGRARQFIFAEDLAAVIERVSRRMQVGFLPYNVAGPSIEPVEIAERTIRLCGKGKIHFAEMPSDIVKIDSGESVLCCSRLIDEYGAIQVSDIDPALQCTIEFFTEASTVRE